LCCCGDGHRSPRRRDRRACLADRQRAVNPVYAGLGTTIFERMSGLARAHGAINLGQGFPDGTGPEDVIRAAADALVTRSNQYPPMVGLPELRDGIAAHYARHHRLDADPAEEIVVTSGATEGIAAALLALVSPGDEVLLFEPLYDAYLPLVQRAGGAARVVRLQPPGWRIDADLLAAAFTPATRLVVLNNPLNPAGRVFDAGELALLAEACVAHDVIAISDEVWEHVVFDGARHLPLIAQPGMRGRTVKIGSAGKIFSLTGWKVGWIVAAPELARGIARAHQFLTFTTPPNLQAAVAYGLAKPAAWFAAQAAGYARAQDRLAAGLTARGYAVRPGEGTYFCTVDLTASGIALDDAEYCERIVREAGVAAIPLSAFFGAGGPRHLVRLCFAKADATLDEAAERLGGFRAALAG
jgi:N-succinyldiaminopimelate aminotransferase